MSSLGLGFHCPLGSPGPSASASRGPAQRWIPGTAGSRGGLTAEAAGVRSKLDGMPKLPRTGGKASTSERAKKPAAKRAAASPPKEATGTRSKRTTRSAATKSRTATPKKKPAANGGNGRGKTKAKPPETDFRHRPVDRHAKHTPAGPKTKLTDDQRVLLGDLFAVVEEYADESVERIDRDLVERAFLFSCERHADQRRASGEDFITHPIGVAKICAGMRLDYGDAVRRAAA